MTGVGTLILKVNGSFKTVIARPSDTLVDVVRGQLQLTGAKPACETGDCGACTLLVDGLPVKACLVLAVEAVGHEITTIEGLPLVPMQKAFVDKFATSCGYCIPGFILNAHALAVHHPDADDAVIAEWLDSNLCRCMSYSEIRDAVRSVLAGEY
jgi:carbon-monoxide dehydrogenase small subunit